jgi:hypothetical protein
MAIDADSNPPDEQRHGSPAGRDDGELLSSRNCSTSWNEFFKASSNLWKEDIEVPVPGGGRAGTVYHAWPPRQPAIIDLLHVGLHQGRLSGKRCRAARRWRRPCRNPRRADAGRSSRVLDLSRYMATVALTVEDPVNRSRWLRQSSGMWVLQKYNDVILDGVHAAQMMSQPQQAVD